MKPPLLAHTIKKLESYGAVSLVLSLLDDHNQSHYDGAKEDYRTAQRAARTFTQATSLLTPSRTSHPMRCSLKATMFEVSSETLIKSRQQGRNAKSSSSWENRIKRREEVGKAVQRSGADVSASGFSLEKTAERFPMIKDTRNVRPPRDFTARQASSIQNMDVSSCCVHGTQHLPLRVAGKENQWTFLNSGHRVQRRVENGCILPLLLH
jgi:hypothetical protein